MAQDPERMGLNVCSVIKDPFSLLVPSPQN